MKKWLVFGIFNLVSFSYVIAQGCSECKARVIKASDDDLSVGNNLNAGILFLMAMPYVFIIGFFIAFFYRDKLKKFWHSIRKKESIEV